MLCTYCGEPATGMDHVVPYSYTNSDKPNGSQGRRSNGHARVPACQDCNNTLSNKMILNVPARAAYLARRLKARFSRVLRSPRWTAEELGELGHGLRASVVATSGLRDQVKQRIEHCQIVAATCAGEVSCGEPAGG